MKPNVLLDSYKWLLDDIPDLWVNYSYVFVYKTIIL